MILEYLANLNQSATYQTSGELEIGKRYIIGVPQGGDDFTNVGALNNDEGTEFDATGTTPAEWSGGTELTIPDAVQVSIVGDNGFGLFEPEWKRLHEGALYFNFPSPQPLNKVNCLSGVTQGGTRDSTLGLQQDGIQVVLCLFDDKINQEDPNSVGNLIDLFRTEGAIAFVRIAVEV